ncbi:MAG: alpha-glucuronidase, partial [Sphingomonadales bacterium]
MRRILLAIVSILLGFAAPNQAHAETGYDLWLRYQPLDSAAKARIEAAYLVVPADRPTLAAAAEELRRGLGGMLGRPLVQHDAIQGDGGIVLGTAASPLIAALGLPLAALGDEGYLIRQVMIGGKRVTVIAGHRDVGVLYGVFAFLKRVQLGQPVIDVTDKPRLTLRVLNHWDDLNRHVERGYAGQSIWDWQKLPGYKDPRYTDYARANASIGINGVVLTNVNANAQILRAEWLAKVKALAEVFRP